MIDLEKMSKEHKRLFARADLKSQLYKLEEEKKENRKDVKYTVNLRAIHDCMLAISKDEARYNLMGISIKDVDGRRYRRGVRLKRG